ncbi:MAG: PTS sugar transporter subunit IIA [Acidobacteria bacterium]|nr:PTS sugar transporter subunit IIA [Acidobacteriota bacterium]
MRLTDFLSAALVDTDLRGRDKTDCLRRMLEMLGRARAIADPEAGLERILERERMMSTGIGDGLAIPHAKAEGMKRNRVAFARVPRGVEFGARDGKPVRLIFLLVGPPDSAAVHVKILAEVARLVGRPEVREGLLAAETPAAVIQLLRKAERRKA